MVLGLVYGYSGVTQDDPSQMTELSLSEKAERLRGLMQADQPFVLPEVWDVASARILADAGFSVIGTSGAAIIWSHGYKSHERIKLEELLMVAARIARGSSLPVNADLDGGLGRSASDVKRGVQAAIAVGCAGVTFGDGSRNGVHGVMPADEMMNRIKAARLAAIEAKVPIAITVRTEVFLVAPLGQSPYDTAVERAQAYFDAGADCILVPGIQHPHVVERLVRNVDCPLGITISLSSAPDLIIYSEIGVSCVSLGSSMMRSLLGNLRVKAEELVTFGHFSHLDRAIPQEELDALLR